MDRCRFRIAGGVLLVVATALPVQGQVPMTPRAVGMAGALMGSARGIDALFLNPANLALPGSPAWSLGLPQVTLAGTLAGLSFSDLVDLVDRDDLSTAEKDRIFGTIPAAGADARIDAYLPLVSFQMDRLAFGVSYTAVGDQAVSRDLIELAVYGYQDGRIDYGVEGTVGTGMTYLDFAVAYADRLGPLSWGVTAHYLRGRTLARSWVTDPRFDLAGSDIDADYVSVYLRGGSGFAVDVGAALRPLPNVTVSAAIANAVGQLSWSDDLYIRNVNLNRTSLDEDFGDLLDRHEESDRRVGPGDAALLQGVTIESLKEQAYLPSTARLGVGWQPQVGTQVGLSYYGAVTGGRMSGSWDRMVGIGIEQRIPLVTLRTGFASNFDQGTLFSGGITLGILELGIARLSDGELDTASRTGWIGSAGLNVRASTTSR